MELLYKAENYLANSFKVRRINGRLMTVTHFERKSEEIFSGSLGKEYERLIKLYPTDADIRKGYENQILFIEMIYRLNLDKISKPVHILDLGSRGGVFPFICKSFGHQAVATDLQEVLEKSPNPELLSLFGIDHQPLKIMPYEEVGDRIGRFDLITGFRTRFHSRYTWETGNKDEEHWGVQEWDFFLRDLAVHHLNEDGRIFFMVNRLQEREKGKVIPKHLRDYFLSVGAKIQYSFLHFDDLSLLR